LAQQPSGGDSPVGETTFNIIDPGLVRKVINTRTYNTEDYKNKERKY
jgi:hypothetical protein